MKELVFSIGSGGASPAVPISFADAGLRERDELQQWIIDHPEILGDELKVVSFEFDRWETYGGTPARDRLDVLALDRAGRLVVAELKRDRASDTTTMQALNYAAMVSRFSLDMLTTSQLLPVPDSESFMVRPKSAPAAQATADANRIRRASIPERLIRHKKFADGDELHIVVPAGVAEDRAAIDAWLDEDQRRRKVTWRQDPRTPVTWLADGESYNLTTLIREIIQRSTGQPPRAQAWGMNWYCDRSGRPLYKIAETLPDGDT